MEAEMTITLKPADVETLIKDYMSKALNKTISKVEFTVENQWRGYGACERPEMVFTGAKVTATTEL